MEPVGAASEYGKDRFFACIEVEDEDNESLDNHIEALKKSHQPAVKIKLHDRFDVAQEFFRWEIATATAGAIMGINAFNQPNVQESKDNTKRLLDAFREKGGLPEEKPSLQEGELSFYGDKSTGSISEALADFFSRAKQGDYLALLAYLTEEEDTQKKLQRIRAAIRKKLSIATTLGYGPRYLHSTGQVHKGGPNIGLFILFTADDVQNLNIPEKPYSFSILKQAQAQGDFEALRKHDRRAVRVHLGSNVAGGLEQFEKALLQALGESA